MKFGKRLIKNSVAEWREKYLDYRILKKIIHKEQTELLRKIGVPNVGDIVDSDQQSHKEFWAAMTDEVNKVEEFYASRMQESSGMLSLLVKQCSHLGLVPKDIVEEGIDTYRIREGRMVSELMRVAPRASSSQRPHPGIVAAARSSVDTQQRGLTSGVHNGVGQSVPLLEHLKSGDAESAEEAIARDAAEIAPYEHCGDSSADGAAASAACSSSKHKPCSSASRTANKRRKAARTLKNSFLEFYRSLLLLQDFCTLNSEAVRKILKKFEKGFAVVARDRWIAEHCLHKSFWAHSELNLCIEQTEHVFSVAFMAGNRHKAMNRLRVPDKEAKVKGFNLGLFLGFAVPLLAICIAWMAKTPGEFFKYKTEFLIVYRMVGLSVLLMWMWGVDMFVWKKFKVNYSFIFAFDPRNTTTYNGMLTSAAGFTALWMASLALYLLGSLPPHALAFLGKVPSQAWPLSLVGFSVFVFVLYQTKNGTWLARVLARTVTAPFHRVVFSDFFLADQLVSLAIALQDVEFTLCFFSYDAWHSGEGVCLGANHIARPIIAILPPLFRLLQCLRRVRDSRCKIQAINAGKYTMSIIVSITSTLRGHYEKDWLMALWILAAVVNTTYSFVWDIKMDWGLAQKGSKSWLLRNSLHYKYAWVYYAGIVQNLVLRLAWTLTISPGAFGVGRGLTPDAFSTVMAALEIYRRGCWNIFRVENEHIHNCMAYRATKELALPVELPGASLPHGDIEMQSVADDIGSAEIVEVIAHTADP